MRALAGVVSVGALARRGDDARARVRGEAFDHRGPHHVAGETVTARNHHDARAVRAQVGQGPQERRAAVDGCSPRHPGVGVPRNHHDAHPRGPRLDCRALGLGPQVLLVGAHPEVGNGAGGVGGGGAVAAGGCHAPECNAWVPTRKGVTRGDGSTPPGQGPWVRLRVARARARGRCGVGLRRPGARGRCASVRFGALGRGVGCRSGALLAPAEARVRTLRHARRGGGASNIRGAVARGGADSQEPTSPTAPRW
jgi:hypothetical protein